MAETDDDFLAGDAFTDIGLRRVRVRIAILNLERHFVRAAVLGTAQRPDGAGDAEYRSDPVPAMTRAVKVEALNSCSAYRFKEVCMARTQLGEGLRP